MRTHGTVRTADGTEVAYQLDGTGPPLLLLAGQANNHHWWDAVRADLLAYRTLSLDWRGTGDSEDGPADFTTRTLAADVVALLDQLGIETLDVYGTSMGGRVAQWLAVDHPDRVRRLVLGCTTPGGPRAVERSQDVRRRLAVADPAAAREAVADLMYTPGWRATHPGPYATVGDPAISPVSARRHLRASARHDAYDVLPRIAPRPWSCTGPTTSSHRWSTPDSSRTVSRTPRCGCSTARGTRTSRSAGPRRPRSCWSSWPTAETPPGGLPTAAGRARVDPMETRRLGRLGHDSSVLIYGAAALSDVTQDVADRSIQEALDGGINHLDVAASYGDAGLGSGRGCRRSGTGSSSPPRPDSGTASQPGARSTRRSSGCRPTGST